MSIELSLFALSYAVFTFIAIDFSNVTDKFQQPLQPPHNPSFLLQDLEKLDYEYPNVSEPYVAENVCHGSKRRASRRRKKPGEESSETL